MLKYVFIFGMEDVWMSFILNDNISGKYCLKIMQTLKGKPVARKIEEIQTMIKKIQKDKKMIHKTLHRKATIKQH